MKKKVIVIIAFIVLFIIVDQLIKIFMINKNINVIPNIVSFEYTKNIGIAFSAEYKMNAILIANLILIISLIYIIIKNYEDTRIVYSLMLVLAGGVSNFIDRISNGYVIDYINIIFFEFPRFNLADIAIVFGIISSIIVIILNEKTKNQTKG